MIEDGKRWLRSIKSGRSIFALYYLGCFGSIFFEIWLDLYHHRCLASSMVMQIESRSLLFIFCEWWASIRSWLSLLSISMIVDEDSRGNRVTSSAITSYVQNIVYCCVNCNDRLRSSWNKEGSRKTEKQINTNAWKKRTTIFFLWWPRHRWTPGHGKMQY